MLGRGSYGFVCEAKNLVTGQKCAIKKVADVFANLVEAKRLLRELRILRVLSKHNQIVEIIDLLPPKDMGTFDTLYIVFEYVDTDLAKLIGTHSVFYYHARKVYYVGNVVWFGIYSFVRNCSSRY
eukprot:TRINITY_DN1657_c0_g1_i4.p2 TRINITY_DN1657_c0_g1~~TRINITY_DN1657_c0_g1_i4.p2  ORF type:complete len:125 (+),score=18.73 TRINITY_DN1657_c0_g1_i4:486-860(+)